MKKIPTAESLLQGENCVLDTKYHTDYIVSKMKEFAKLHVKAALEAAAKKAKAVAISDYAADRLSKNDIGVDQSSILNAYPEKLIK